jgi:hypothetical protein
MTLVISAAILEGMRIGLSVIHLKGGDGRCLTLDALDETTRLIYKADYFGPSVDAFIRLPDETMKGDVRIEVYGDRSIFKWGDKEKETGNYANVFPEGPSMPSFFDCNRLSIDTNTLEKIAKKAKKLGSDKVVFYAGGNPFYPCSFCFSGAPVSGIVRQADLRKGGQ